MIDDGEGEGAVQEMAWDMMQNEAISKFRSTWGFDVVKGQPVADSAWKYELVVPTRSLM